MFDLDPTKILIILAIALLVVSGSTARVDSQPEEGSPS
jgi:Sec-independent protein translocase protein TatA